MSSGRQQPMVALLLELLPPDGTRVANGRLFERLHDAAHAAGLHCGEQDFAAVREALVAAGQAVKGPGRGGSTARVVGAIAGRATGVADGAPPAHTDGPAVEEQRPELSLQAQSAPAERPFAAPSPTRMAAPKPGAPRRSDPAPGAPQVLSYRHPDRRINNPEVGLVNEASDPAQPKTTWAYDPHLDPVLQWAGKAERGSFEVDTVSLHVHERVDPMSILAAVARSRADKAGKARPHGIQPGLFEAPFESLPLRDAVDFYRHDKGWSNRLVAGDSLLVMNSLLVKEGLAGQVQMIYIDPPYGIRYGSNFQPFVNKRDVKDRADADLTQEPEMIKAFRDTWELGIHSYLTYLRDRLLMARELLSETGSVFVQISDENLHHVRELCDEVFGTDNFMSVIAFRKTSAVSSPNARVNVLGSVTDYMVWYARCAEKVKYRQLYLAKTAETDSAGVYQWGQSESGRRRRLSTAERSTTSERVFSVDNITSAGWSDNLSRPFEVFGVTCSTAENRHWATHSDGMRRLGAANRLTVTENSARYVRFMDDFAVYPIVNTWDDTGTGSFTDDKVYVVQTGVKALERCLLMTTDPGDLVLDPTCGSGTTAYVAEKWGRRWITCDTSRVAVTLAKTRLMTASYDYYELRYPHEGLKGGFIYKTVPHVTLKSIANNPEIDSIHERLHPAIVQALADLNAALRRDPPAAPFTVTEGVRKGQALQPGQPGADLHEWEVPFPAQDGDGGAAPAGWSEATHAPFAAFHAARQRMQAEMDRSIAAHADSETLYDQPEKARNKLRITGPFSV